MEPEIWKPVKNFEHLYEVSNHGNIRRIFYKNKVVKIVLRPKLSTNGYLMIGLRDYENEIRKWFLMHRLTAIAFIPNTENKGDVNHKDGNKRNNYIDNLEWATRKENIMHSWAMGLSKINSGCFKKKAS